MDGYLVADEINKKKTIIVKDDSKILDRSTGLIMLLKTERTLGYK